MPNTDNTNTDDTNTDDTELPAIQMSESSMWDVMFLQNDPDPAVVAAAAVLRVAARTRGFMPRSR